MHSFLRHRRYPDPAPMAHRGYSARYPENTMPAFEAAVSLGYQYVETDVHATSDGRLVAFHDEGLDRLTDRCGLISELSWGEVRKARVAGREPIPLLAELLDAWPDLRINIDAKNDDSVGPLLALLQGTDAWERVGIGSFSGRRLDLLRRVAGERLCTSMAHADVIRLKFASLGLPVGRFQANCVQIPVFYKGMRVITRKLVAAAHARGLPVHAWTVNDRKEMAELLDIGVDGIITDEAELAVAVFRSHGIGFGPTTSDAMN